MGGAVEHMKHAHFVLICEGSSDEGLVDHIKDLLVLAGMDEVTGVAPDFRRLPTRISKDMATRLRVALKLEPSANLVLVHRDADSRDPEPRYREISEAVKEAVIHQYCISIVPVQETEAWLLLDEDAIRRVAGNPRGTVLLPLPPPKKVEGISDPKSLLKDLILTASAATGRKREKLRKRFPELRTQLVRNLTPNENLRLLRSWERFSDDIANYVQGFEE
jgi:hypothetical protein